MNAQVDLLAHTCGPRRGRTERSHVQNHTRLHSKTCLTKTRAEEVAQWCRILCLECTKGYWVPPQHQGGKMPKILSSLPTLRRDWFLQTTIPHNHSFLPIRLWNKRTFTPKMLYFDKRLVHLLPCPHKHTQSINQNKNPKIAPTTTTKGTASHTLMDKEKNKE